MNYILDHVIYANNSGGKVNSCILDEEAGRAAGEKKEITAER